MPVAHSPHEAGPIQGLLCGMGVVGGDGRTRRTRRTSGAVESVCFLRRHRPPPRGCLHPAPRTQWRSGGGGGGGEGVTEETESRRHEPPVTALPVRTFKIKEQLSHRVDTIDIIIWRKTIFPQKTPTQGQLWSFCLQETVFLRLRWAAQYIQNIHTLSVEGVFLL